ncbi:hypothetical protein Ancab_036625, partial [Ancistrocladus abbreviatus]
YILTGFRGQRVSLTFNSGSHLYQGVVSKCRILHGRYLATPWLASPHLQTAFLSFFRRPPVFSNRRKIFLASDGGTIAPDWLLSSDVLGGGFYMKIDIHKDDRTPIMVVIPGLTSDSNSAYIKHLAYTTAKRGWNVVANHRGLVVFLLPITNFCVRKIRHKSVYELVIVSENSDCFYNAGWMEDVHILVHYLHNEYPNAPLFLVGTSIEANILVKYLGEDGDDTPLAGAIAICSPWDLLILTLYLSGSCLCLKLVRSWGFRHDLPIAVAEYMKLVFMLDMGVHVEIIIVSMTWILVVLLAPLNLNILSQRLAVGQTSSTVFTLRPSSFANIKYLLSFTSLNFRFAKLLVELVSSSSLFCYCRDSEASASHSIQDFDNHATCLVGKYETVDTYYRRCSSANFVGNVSVPLLCISALDDPLCTREAIAWDECRLNKNIVLATTQHGGHLAFFEGITASGLWWVRAVIEFLNVLHSSPCMHVQKKRQISGFHCPSESSIGQGPYVNVAQDGMVAAVGNKQTTNDVVVDSSKLENTVDKQTSQMTTDKKQDGQLTEESFNTVPTITERNEHPTRNNEAISPSVTY